MNYDKVQEQLVLTIRELAIGTNRKHASAVEESRSAEIVNLLEAARLAEGLGDDDMKAAALAHARRLLGELHSSVSSDAGSSGNGNGIHVVEQQEAP